MPLNGCLENLPGRGIHVLLRNLVWGGEFHRCFSLSSCECGWHICRNQVCLLLTSRGYTLASPSQLLRKEFFPSSSFYVPLLPFPISFYRSLFFLLIGFRGRKGEREREIPESQLPPIHTPTGDLTHNLNRYSDKVSNPQPFGAWDNVPTNPATPARAAFLILALWLSKPRLETCVGLVSMGALTCAAVAEETR